MTHKVLLFGIVKDLLGNEDLALTENITSVGKLRELLEMKLPNTPGLRTFMIAVNEEYATDDTPLTGHEEIAIIPPVSGG